MRISQSYVLEYLIKGNISWQTLQMSLFLQSTWIPVKTEQACDSSDIPLKGQSDGCMDVREYEGIWNVTNKKKCTKRKE